MPSNADPLGAAITTAAQRLHAAAQERSRPPLIILIDGRSGAGKSTLASRLKDLWSPPTTVACLGLDEVYPGWDGLAAASDALAGMLREARSGRPLVWRGWDWTQGAWGSELRCGPADVLIVEGAGAVTADTAGIADLRVWVDAPAAERRERALRRDGETFRPHWERWALQEDRHILTHRPGSLADLTIELP